ncbi:acetyltransferase [Podospora didyma]|uniref:Acetyltransferase n=1 Tax=Podospora didyma TaxID=330526 RepID=A0AAE0P028_9PEZI|nr:acetyltransferase [Podospora didyma]
MKRTTRTAPPVTSKRKPLSHFSTSRFYRRFIRIQYRLTPRTGSRQPAANGMGQQQNVGAGPIAELNLNYCSPNGILDRINAVPGLKPSTAFFTFLRANLVLSHSAMSSNVSTPLLEPHIMPPTASSPVAAKPSKPSSQTTLDDIPPLSLEVLTEQVDKVAALKLIADSIAQQRQKAAHHLMTHPYLLPVLLMVLTVFFQSCIAFASWDFGTVLGLGCGIVMIYLIAIRYVVEGYISLAEQMSMDWITTDEGEDTIIGTRFGNEIIGALLIHFLPNPALSGSGKKKNRNLGLKGGTGVIRAWTTKLRYRRKGVGLDMLREAVRMTREKFGKDAEVGFSRAHANSVMILWEKFNGPFRDSEKMATRALAKVLLENEKRKK